ncbi:MAG: hypothetical protein WC107_07405 [Patescibacteria group bacterium]
MKEFTLRSSHGTITADADTGVVSYTSLSDEWSDELPAKIDVEEWRNHYFGETLQGEHDVLDFGYWYTDEKTGELAYSGPDEEWRELREQMRQEEDKQ